MVSGCSVSGWSVGGQLWAVARWSVGGQSLGGRWVVSCGRWLGGQCGRGGQ